MKRSKKPARQVDGQADQHQQQPADVVTWHQQTQAGASNPATPKPGQMLAPIAAFDQMHRARPKGFAVDQADALTSRSTLAGVGMVPAMAS